MNIAIVASYAPSILGFRKHFVMELSKKWNVVVFAPFHNEETTQSIFASGIDYEIIPMSNTRMNPIFDLHTMYVLSKKLKEKQIDTIFNYTIKPVIWGSIAARNANIKNIYSLITGLGYAFTDVSTIRKKLIHKIVINLYKKSLRYNNTIFFQNPDDLNLFSELGIVSSSQHKIIVNGSGVDLKHFNFSDLPPLPIKFVMIARLLKHKGVQEYIDAAASVKKIYPEAQFHLVGWIDTNPSAIKKSLLDDAINAKLIHFHGRLQDVRDVLRSSHVYVLPSYREGIPVSVLEAMSMGRPIITTDAPGCRETVVDGLNGFLVPIKNADKLVEEMLFFINNPHLILEMGLASRKIAEEKYDVNKVNHCIINAMGLVD